MNLDKIQQAFDWVIKEANGEGRNFGPDKNNLPYWSHLYIVFEELIKLGVKDENILLAGILHDLVEDYAVTLDDIESKFGKEVAQIVDLCTKKDDYDKYNPEHMKEYFDRMRSASEYNENIRKAAMLIKIADRITNIVGILFIRDKFRIEKYIEETEKYFIPIAELVGGKDRLINSLNYTKAIFSSM